MKRHNKLTPVEYNIFTIRIEYTAGAVCTSVHRKILQLVQGVGEDWNPLEV
jgi:hypothetical protein